MGKSIVKVSVYKTGDRKRGQQYALRLVLDDGTVIKRRLFGCYPTVEDIKDESIEILNRIELTKLNVIQELVSRGPIVKGRYKSCLEAMKAFEIQMKRDSHGNAFREYFGEMNIMLVPQNVSAYVDWLLEKYNRIEQTVCKKVFAASALFKWLKKTGNWSGHNPFHGALEGVKFAPPQKQKSIIEPDEMERLTSAMRNESLKEIRIYTTIMYFTGLRPSEAINLKWENLDTERLTLLYLRTKRKNKTPDWRRIPIPAQFVSFLINEGRTDNHLIRVGKSGLRAQMEKASDVAQVGGVTAKTYRKDFACRARIVGASKDDVNLYQGRDESVLEHHYTTDEWFIVHQCRWWIDKLFDEKPKLEIIK